jgi:hypothetical protein
MRIHNTIAPGLYLDAKYEQRESYNLKPFGLWYSFDDAWKAWCSDNMPERLFANDFELVINEINLLIIKDFKTAVDITVQHKNDKYWNLGIHHVDWNKLSKTYSGIEIPDYWSLKKEMWKLPGPVLTWFYAWDVPSGCIWDLSIINSIEKIENQ